VRAHGRDFAIDVLVIATGFDAMTGALMRIDIRGRGDTSLRERWADGPSSYLGLAMADFPNLFTVTGPGSPSVFTNMLPTIEQHVDWIADCLAYMKARNYMAIEAEGDAEKIWWEHVQDVAAEGLKECFRQAPGLHALLRRLPRLLSQMRGGRGQRLSGVCVRVSGGEWRTDTGPSGARWPGSAMIDGSWGQPSETGLRDRRIGNSKAFFLPPLCEQTPPELPSAPASVHPSPATIPARPAPSGSPSGAPQSDA
ncbi:MAG: hypothetical protein ACYSVY_28825, partial [Planctomycetota bacterium]|jgi:hypothetical protein